jgi:hypothetical protein
MSVVDENPSNGHVVRVDGRRDLAIPFLEQMVYFLLGVGASAVHRHHDALHEDFAIALFAGKPARSPIGSDQAKSFYEVFGGDHDFDSSRRILGGVFGILVTLRGPIP